MYPKPPASNSNFISMAFTSSAILGLRCSSSRRSSDAFSAASRRRSGSAAAELSCSRSVECKPNLRHWGYGDMGYIDISPVIHGFIYGIFHGIYLYITGDMG